MRTAFSDLLRRAHRSAACPAARPAARPAALCFTALLSALLTALPARAEEFRDPYENYDETAAFDMELEENLATPPVQAAEKGAVTRYMNALARQLKARYAKVETLRAGEVVVLTIGTDDLFLPNDTILTRDGEQLLRPLLGLFKNPDMFKFVYAVHTDNTGSDIYREELAATRSQTLYSWFIDTMQVNPDQFIINYDMSSHRPLGPNDSRAGRAANRRVEFFIVPGPRLITLAHKKSIK